jgi:hypothetical protein
MLHLVEPVAPPVRRYEIFTIEGDLLSKHGVRAGDELVVACDEFSPGDYHAFDRGGGRVRAARSYSRLPGIIGRVVLPDQRADLSLEPLPDEGMHFNADKYGNITELDDALIERCWGVRAREMYGFGFINHLAPRARAPFCAAWSRAVAQGGVFQLSTVAQRLDGLCVPLSVLAIPTRCGGWTGVTQPGEFVQVA